MTLYDARDLTPDVIISLYLYGTDSPPTDLVSESLIRPADSTTSIQVDMASYFASAGRFANASMSPLVQQFFTSNASQLAGTGSKQELTAAQLASLLGLSVGFSFQQYNYDDAAHDRAARTRIRPNSSSKRTVHVTSSICRSLRTGTTMTSSQIVQQRDSLTH